MRYRQINMDIIKFRVKNQDRIFMNTRLTKVIQLPKYFQNKRFIYIDTHMPKTFFYLTLLFAYLIFSKKHKILLTYFNFNSNHVAFKELVRKIQ